MKSRLKLLLPVVFTAIVIIPVIVAYNRISKMFDDTPAFFEILLLGLPLMLFIATGYIVSRLERKRLEKPSGQKKNNP